MPDPRAEIRELLVAPPQFRDEDRPVDGTFEAETSDVIREQAADDLLAQFEAAVERRVADWIEQHDPANELTWFIDSLREGLAAHKPCKQCWTPDEETT